MYEILYIWLNCYIFSWKSWLIMAVVPSTWAVVKLKPDPDGSAWLVNIQADFGSAQNIQLLHGFFARPELLMLAKVDCPGLVGRKRDRGKTRSSSVSCSGFLLSVRSSSPLSNSFFICSLEVGFLRFPGSSTPAMLPVFLSSFANAL